MSRVTKVILQSSKKATFEVDVSVACKSQILKSVMEDIGTDVETWGPIVLNNVPTKTLIKIIQYCEYHTLQISDEIPPIPEDQMKQWDAGFVKTDKAVLFDLLLAADYLYIQNLIDLVAKAIADMIPAKTPEEIRKIFNIKQTDFTPEEEAEVRKENEWGKKKKGRMSGPYSDSRSNAA